RSGAELLGWLRRARITHAVLPAATLSGLPDAELPLLSVVVAVGQGIASSTVARWRPHRRLVQTYGPAETASFAVSGECAADRRRPALGRGWDNLRLYVLDEKGQPVPVGVAGELFVGGRALARGYDARPGRTAAAWVPDPFGPVAGGRLFRTGERARWRSDGQVQLLGRVDEQIRIRGFRVEPEEIEAMLVTEPGVRDALVTARDGQLVAYVATGGGTPPAAARLRDHLRERLPEYMVPAAFVLLDGFPLSPDGRVDPRALPAPDGGHEHEGYVAPQGELERQIAAVWRELLQIARVGVHENFFEIGGHSLLLTRMHERLRETLGREVSMIDLFQYPTVATLAQHLEGGSAAQEAEAPKASKDRGAMRRAAYQRRR
ncbi:MAG TPA: AMP-binding protein, partial [Longimicrobiaceae bacterium]|nr:AMP-binding protein [Longimicrobiaceae bacterium]